MAELSGALPTLRAWMNHGFPPGSRRGGWFAPHASRCLPAIPVPDAEGLEDGPRSPSVPRGWRGSQGWPRAHWQPRSPRLCLRSKPPSPWCDTALQLKDGNWGGSWGELGGGCSRFEAETSSTRLVKWLVNRGSVGWEQGCAGMLKKQQSSRKTPQIWSKSGGFPRGSSHIQGDTGLNNLVWESLKR